MNAAAPAGLSNLCVSLFESDLCHASVDAPTIALSWPRAGTALRLHCMPYAQAEFASERYAQAAIACPSLIASASRQRQAEFFFGRLCARAALAEYGLAQAQIGIGQHRQPLWPAGLIGSITHSKRCAAALVLPAADYAGVGLDMEMIVDEAGAQALRSVAVSARELACLARWEERLDHLLALTLVFSAKESFFKATYPIVQRYFDFDALELEALDISAGCLVFRVCQPLCAQWQPGDRCRIDVKLLGHAHVASLFVW